jgi:hypothetical protein
MVLIFWVGKTYLAHSVVIQATMPGAGVTGKPASIGVAVVGRAAGIKGTLRQYLWACSVKRKYIFVKGRAMRWTTDSRVCLLLLLVGSVAMGIAIAQGVTTNAGGKATVTAWHVTVGPTLRTSFDLGQSNVRPTWSNGVLLVVDRNRTASPAVHVIDKQGIESLAVSVTIPDADRISLTGVGRAPDGVITVGGFSWTADGREATFIAVISGNGKAQETMRTLPYTPYALAVAPDGTIWTAGLEMFKRSEKDPRIDPAYGVVRHFDRLGHFLASFVPRSSLTQAPLGVAESHLVATNDRVGWLWGDNYCEVSTSGAVRHFRTPPIGEMANVALTDHGGTFLAAVDSESRLYSLEGGSWLPVSLPPTMSRKMVLFLYGVDDNRLVAREGSQRSVI